MPFVCSRCAAIFCSANVLLLLIALTVLMTGTFTAGKRMHESLLRSLLRVPMWVFDTTPIGRILNRL